ncbi:cullin-3 [Saitozyma podzolica]|uniref:Cullin-3 n=1 Tax=Saitozyma podzolica TaxID=1890683 RepID=A0A427YK74_9TREE|nr:cullin-3 [Saitozyma podzolica]
MSMSMPAARRGKPKIRPPRKNHNASKLSFEEHYRYAYNMVLFKHGDQLYTGVKQLVAEHLDSLAEERIVPAFPRSSGTHGAGKLGGGAEAVERAMEGDRFLKAVKGVWEDHTGSMRKLKDVLRYMIYEVGLTLFLTHIIRSPRHPIHTHLIATLLSQVQLERDGETITRSTVRECVDVLLRLTDDRDGKNVYLSDFEPEFLRRSGEFYRLEASEMLESGDAGLYLRNPILHMPGTGLAPMLDADRIADLRRLYVLFLRVPDDAGRLALRLALRGDIEERGKEINEGTKDEPGPSQNGEPGMDVDEDVKGKGKAKASGGATALASALRWVQDVLDLKDKFDRAFQSFINANPRAPEFLSLFIDEHLKKGTKADEIDAALEKTIVLFRFLADKDKFERYYKNHLAKRLLYARSASDDAEKGMVAKLKVEIGRRLTWQGSLGTADVKIRFKARSHDVNMSTHALVVLLLFDDDKDGEGLSYTDIKASTDMPDPELQRTLQSLALGKYRILQKAPKGRDVNPTDTFTFNDSFTCPLARFKIMQVVARVESAKEREETQEMVDEERRHQVEACIVRVMKNRKTMGHNELISEVAHQLSSRFNPSMALIKKRIEGLIDYLERTADIGTYRYLA